MPVQGIRSGKEHVLLPFLLGYGFLVRLFCRASICVHRHALGPLQPREDKLAVASLKLHHCLNLGY